ncbi:MAG: hypothetical protein U0325_27450 [Polyangiales bacterium]
MHDVVPVDGVHRIDEPGPSTPAVLYPTWSIHEAEPLWRPMVADEPVARSPMPTRRL